MSLRFDARRAWLLGAGALLAAAGSLCHAQSERGELRLRVESQAGVPLAANGTIVSESREFQQAISVDGNGQFTVSPLLFGAYQVRLQAPGFNPQQRDVQITSSVPVSVAMRLQLATVVQRVEVRPGATLLDPLAAGASIALGRAELAAMLPAQPGRGLLDLIRDQPGWIFEANGVLHPRGSEYDTQFVINGVPRTENLSPSFASPLPADIVEAAQLRTAGFPAEYGRSLGGVVDATTASTHGRGTHGELAASGGSFATANGAVRLGLGTRAQQLTMTAESYRTDRFLDPPVLDNFSNRATGASATLDEQFEVSSADQVEVDYSFSSLHAMVPNELVQAQNGQRQDRGSRQQQGSVAWQHSLSPSLLMTTAGSVLDTSVSLASNALSTPIEVSQARGFRQGWLGFNIAGHLGRNDWKAGGDTILRRVHEQLAYNITDATAFDPGTQQAFTFEDARWDTEPAAYLEDTLHLGRWNISAGLRYDAYSFVVHQSAWSPRASVSCFMPKLHLQLHGSYDHVFQLPAIENLLLASSPQVDSVESFVQRLPVQPARANYYELGFAQELRGRLLISGNVFLRRFNNYSDDDTLLNTGVSFPIADRSARISGEELSVRLTEWRHITANLSYSNQTGVAAGPITGGLLLGADQADTLISTDRFAISQDQRNTLRAQMRWALMKRLWVGAHAQYNSGLPVELDGDPDLDALRAAYGDRVVGSINFDRGRVKPWNAIDLSAGGPLLHRQDQALNLEVNVSNIANRVNVINFASLFSGTAISTPRAVEARLRYSF